MHGTSAVRVRTLRDRHGGEIILLTHSSASGAEQPKQLVIFAHRTVPGLRMGRLPFDEDTVRLLEDRHPDLDFDWSKLFRAVAASGSVTVAADALPSTVSVRPRLSGEASRGQRRGGRSAAGRESGGAGAVEQIEQAPGVAAEGSRSAVGAAPEQEAGGPSAAVTPPRAPTGVVAAPRALPDVRGTPPGAPAPASGELVAPPGSHADDECAAASPPAAEGASDATPAPSLASRYAALLDRIEQRVREPERRAALLHEASALEPARWPEPLAPEARTRVEGLYAAFGRRLSLRRRRGRRGQRGERAFPHDDAVDAVREARQEGIASPTPARGADDPGV